MKAKLIHFFKRETVLCAALALAAVSMFFVHPDAEYLSYIDFRTLAILFCLMGTMSGLQKIGLFQWVAQGLLGKVKTTRQLVYILVLLCFFSSMAVTNDVALITFVPFTFTVLHLVGDEAGKRLMIPTVVLQTIAANLGSMLTPIGNPHNLYLYGRSGVSLRSFLLLMLPYTAISLLFILLWSTVRVRQHLAPVQVSFEGKVGFSGKRIQLSVFLLLFAVDLLAVAQVIPYGAALLVTVIAILFTDRSIFARVDYSLLLTFVGFFIFIGNMKRLPVFREFLQQIVSGNELLVGVAASQVISNVPAALLLSEFTDDLSRLTVGVNIGGLGTLIASMANLISYKLVIQEDKAAKGAYFRRFTLDSLCFLAILLLFSFLFA